MDPLPEGVYPRLAHQYHLVLMWSFQFHFHLALFMRYKGADKVEVDNVRTVDLEEKPGIQFCFQSHQAFIIHVLLVIDVNHVNDLVIGITIHNVCSVQQEMFHSKLQDHFLWVKIGMGGNY